MPSPSAIILVDLPSMTAARSSRSRGLREARRWATCWRGCDAWRGLRSAGVGGVARAEGGEALGDLLAGLRLLAAPAIGGDGGLHALQQHFFFERFFEEVGGAELQGFDGGADAAVGGQHDDGHLLVLPPTAGGSAD